MNDLWMRFHGLQRPDRPTVDDAIEVIEDSGVTAQRLDHAGLQLFGGFSSRDKAVAFIRKRLCLSATSDAEIAEALGERLAQDEYGWHVGPAQQERVTLWWAPPG
jgi:hypothetical protein